MRPRSGTTLTFTLALAVALAACRTARPAPEGKGAEGPAAPSALRVAAGPGADVELMWQPSPTHGVVYAILDAQGKRVGLTGRTRFRVSAFGITPQRCYSVVALDEANRASTPTAPACLGPAAPTGGEARPAEGEPEAPSASPGGEARPAEGEPVSPATPPASEARPAEGQPVSPATPPASEARPAGGQPATPAAPPADEARPPAGQPAPPAGGQSSWPQPRARTTSGALAS